VRVRQLVLTAALLGLFAPAHAQEWTDFTSREDRFTVNFPGQPRVETITWASEYGMVFPGRVYRASRGPQAFTLTVIDYNDAERQYLSKPHPPAFEGTYWRIDVVASVQYAATKLYRQRQGARISYDAWHHIDRVSGHQLNLTNPDGTRTFAALYLHENRLYILDGTVPADGPEPGLFTQSLSFLDAAGQRVRYDDIYFNRVVTTVPNAGRGGRGRGQGPGQGQ
jgi:hypothetical protein